MRKSEARSILGIGPRATPEARRAAFRRRARQVHPDHGGDAEDFRQLMTAMEVLEGEPPALSWDVDLPPPEHGWWAYDSPPPRRPASFGKLLRSALRHRSSAGQASETRPGPGDGGRSAHYSDPGAEAEGSAWTRTKWITDDRP